MGHVRDYTSDADDALSCLDPTFRPELTSLFKEHAPVEEDHVRERLTIATQQLSDLNREAKDAMYAADTVALAHDLAQIGQVYKAITQNEHSKKTEKILHLKAQNAIGSAIVADHMNANMAVHSGVIKDQLNVAERVRRGQTSFNFLKMF